MRIGPKMQAAADYVTANPGRVMYKVAMYVAPSGRPGGNLGVGYGYRTVWRAVAAGLIKTAAGKGNSRLCYPPS